MKKTITSLLVAATMVTASAGMVSSESKRIVANSLFIVPPIISRQPELRPALRRSLFQCMIAVAGSAVFGCNFAAKSGLANIFNRVHNIFMSTGCADFVEF